MDNSEKLATQGTQDKDEQNKNTTQYVLDTNNINKTRALLIISKTNPRMYKYQPLSIFTP